MTWGAGWVALAVPLLALVAIGSWWWRRRIVAGAAGVGAGQHAHTTSQAMGRAVVRAACLWGGLGLCVLALAQPRWGGGQRDRAAHGADVVVLLDCSRSMLATDLVPSRLEAARRACLDLLREAPHLRLGLMPFAGTAVLRCPPTGDAGVLTDMLEDCSPELFPASAGLQGTAIGLAVTEALAVLGRSHVAGQAILVVSDGADPDAAAVQAAAQRAKDAGVPVFGLFAGDPERPASLLIDGQQQTMTADTTTLHALATATGGLWVAHTLDGRASRLIAEGIDRVAGGRDWEERRQSVAAERYRWLLVPGLACLILGVLMPTRRRGRR
jgi:Ca-activated chloride channel homolog